MSDSDIERAVADDPDAAPILKDDWFTKADLTVPGKKAISIRLDADVLAFFQGTGSRYQTRINQVLRAYVDAHKKSAK